MGSCLCIIRGQRVISVRGIMVRTISRLLRNITVPSLSQTPQRRSQLRAVRRAMVEHGPLGLLCVVAPL